MSVLRIEGATVRFGSGHTRVTAVDGVNLELETGQCLGLVGESGSGKSTLGRAIVGLVPLAAGRIRVDGEDVKGIDRLGRRQLVFQDPNASLNPHMTVGDSIAEGLRRSIRGRLARAEAVATLLDQVRLSRDVAGVLPSQLSGGQRQRVALARALAAKPSLLVADEITSALDVSVQGAILNLVRELQRSGGFSLLFISHNLAVVRYVADTIAVMYCGQIVETAPTDRIVADPQHPYTRSLFDAVPRIGDASPLSSTTEAIDGDPADPADPPSGCRFHPRCPVGPGAKPERSVCTSEDPITVSLNRKHRAACFFAATDDAGAGGEETHGCLPMEV